MTRIRGAQPADAAAVAAIYNEGIEERQATFVTRSREPDEISARIASTLHVFVVAERDDEVVGWAASAPYSDMHAYAGVSECAVYVARSARGTGVGAAMVDALAREAAGRGGHKLVAKLFPTNLASRRLFARCGYREVGLHVRHGRMDGEWRDVLLLELLLS